MPYFLKFYKWDDDLEEGLSLKEATCSHSMKQIVYTTKNDHIAEAREHCIQYNFDAFQIVSGVHNCIEITNVYVVNDYPHREIGVDINYYVLTHDYVPGTMMVILDDNVMIRNSPIVTIYGEVADISN